MGYRHLMICKGKTFQYDKEAKALIVQKDGDPERLARVIILDEDLTDFVEAFTVAQGYEV